MRSPLEPGFQMPAHYPVHRELSVRTHSLLSPHTAVKNSDSSGAWSAESTSKLPALYWSCTRIPWDSWNSSLAGKLPENSGYISWGRAVSQLCCKSGAILKDFQKEKTGEDEGFGKQILKAIKIIDSIKTRTISLFDFSIIILDFHYWLKSEVCFPQLVPVQPWQIPL